MHCNKTNRIQSDRFKSNKYPTSTGFAEFRQNGVEERRGALVDQ